MAVSLTLGGTKVSFDVTEFERAIAGFCANNNITTQAAYDTAVDGLTGPQQTAAVKAILRCIRIG